MKINGVDISTKYDGKVRFWRLDPGAISFKNESEWIRGAPLPMFDRVTRSFKEFTITFMVYGSGREDIEWRANRVITDLMAAPADFEFDDRTHFFRGVLEKSSLKEHSDKSRKRFQTLVIDFVGYEYGASIEYLFSGIGAAEVQNDGTAISPMIIELTPTIGQSGINLNGICHHSVSGADITVAVRNLTAGKTIVMDGIHGLITEDGSNKTNDIDIWALPSMRPGVNTVTFGTSYVDVKIKILPILGNCETNWRA